MSKPSGGRKRLRGNDMTASQFDVYFEHDEKKYSCVGKATPGDPGCRYHPDGSGTPPTGAEAEVYSMFVNGIESTDEEIDKAMGSEDFYCALVGAIEARWRDLSQEEDWVKHGE